MVPNVVGYLEVKNETAKIIHIAEYRVILPCGRTLGGGSTVNALVMSRGNRKNYDEWAKLGAQGWSYDDVFQYFIKLEDNRDPVFAMNVLLPLFQAEQGRLSGKTFSLYICFLFSTFYKSTNYSYAIIQCPLQWRGSGYKLMDSVLTIEFYMGEKNSLI
ncbi:UNVERIFIED_CONTAM: Gld [Trichonephila clavipes]